MGARKCAVKEGEDANGTVLGWCLPCYSECRPPARKRRGAQCPSLLTPIFKTEAAASSGPRPVWPGSERGDRWIDAYNFYQSSSHIHIEQAFGMLSWRWGVFWRPLRVPFARRPSLVRACFRLRNFCRGNATARDCVVAPWGNDSVGCDTSFAPTDMKGSNQHGRRRDCERSNLRFTMTRRVQERGLLRPEVGSFF